MSKLRLHIDDLTVDTFATGEAGLAGRGTVDGHSPTVGIACSIATAKTSLTCCPCTPML